MTEIKVTAQSVVCVIIGHPVRHSLSPIIHNAGYKAAKLSFVMVAADISPENLEDALRGFRAIGIGGLSVTMPHKVAIAPLLDHIDPIAAEIGAVNTVVHRSGSLHGYNTDWIGVVKPLERVTSLKDKRVAIIGAGGAAQAAIFAASRRGAHVVVLNRTPAKAADLAQKWNCESAPLDQTDLISSADIIINCTSVGMGSEAGLSPIPTDILSDRHIVFETIYAPHTTTLVAAAERAGARVLRGSEMFLEQALAQFELQTGSSAPREAMDRALWTSMQG